MTGRSIAGGKAAWIAAAVVALGTLTGALVFDTWNARTQPIFPRRPHIMTSTPLQYAAQPDFARYMGVVPSRSPALRWTAWFAGGPTHNYRHMMRSQILLYVVLVALAAAAGWGLSGPWGGAAAGLLTAFSGLSALYTLGFDDNLADLVCVFGAMAALAWSDGLRRPGWALPAGVFAGLTMRTAFIASNGLLALAVPASTAACGAAWGFLARRRPVLTRGATGEVRRAEPWRAPIGPVLFFVAVAVTGFTGSNWASFNPAYYLRESEHTFFPFASEATASMSPWVEKISGWLAYPYLAWKEYLGWACVPLVAGLIALVWVRPRGWAAFVFGPLIPFVALCAISKKNPYYAVGAMGVALVAAGAGLGAINKRRARAAAVVVAVALTAGWTGWRLVAGRPAADVPVIMRHFQEQPAFFVDRPRTEPYEEQAFADAIVEHVRQARPHGDVLLLMLDKGLVLDRLEPLRYFLLSKDPRITLLIPQTDSGLPFLDDAPYLLELLQTEQSPVLDPPELFDRSIADFEAVASSFSASGGVQYLRRLARRDGGYGVAAQTSWGILFAPNGL